jgi:thiamine biosynthesis lipoprotein
MFLQTARLAVALVLVSALCGCRGGHPPTTQKAAGPTTRPGPQRFEYEQVRMGVKMRLVLYAEGEEVALNAARAAYHRVQEIDDIASDYQVDSELNRLCRKAGDGPVKVSPELFYLLQKSMEFSEVSDGGFDVTCGPLVRLWRTARKVKRLPPVEEIEKAKALVGYKKMHLDPVERTVRLDTPGMQLDLGGIAKGYAGDCAIAQLQVNGVNSALFECGGDIVVSDPPPGATGWIISVIDPVPHPKPKLVLLHNCAISTSGDTEQFVVIDGKRYSHVVDPRTGYGLTSRVMCTVIAADGISSDPLSKVVNFLGPEAAPKLLKIYPGLKYYLRVAED